MKPIRNILLLSILTGSIICFWLMPVINTARPATYTRVYEDTGFQDLSTKILTSDTVGKVRQTNETSKKTEKVYKKETIRSVDKLKALNPLKFSRAVHFIEEPLVMVTGDSLELIQSRDSIISY